MEYNAVKLHGACAVTAWGAYLRNRTHFRKQQREHAGTLAHPDVAWFALPRHAIKFMPTLAHETSSEAKNFGDRAAAVLILSEPHGHVQNILYVHRRDNFHGTGLASMLLRKAKENIRGLPRPSVLLATVESWDAFLFLIRNGFRCNADVSEVSMPKSAGCGAGSSSSVIHVSWSVGATNEEHLAFLGTVVSSVAKRRLAPDSQHDEIEEALRDVYDSCARKTADSHHALRGSSTVLQMATTPRRLPPPVMHTLASREGGWRTETSARSLSAGTTRPTSRLVHAVVGPRQHGARQASPHGQGPHGSAPHEPEAARHTTCGTGVPAVGMQGALPAHRVVCE